MVAEIHQLSIGCYLVIAITPAMSMNIDGIEWQPSCTLFLPRLLLLEGQPMFWPLAGHCKSALGPAFPGAGTEP